MRIPESILRKVEKPGRYTGGEWGREYKPKETVSTRFAFCFPDIYEIGMSNLGVRILRDVLNKLDFCSCEACFSPWSDMEEQLRTHNIPLCAIESGDPLNEFDIVAFSIQYELCYTTMVNMLELGKIPICSSDRTEDDPIVIAGGPCAFNPEPVAEFVDAFLIGEGEYEIADVARCYDECKKKGYSREQILREFSHIKGLYIPSLYEVEYNDDGTIRSFEPKYEDVPKTVVKRIVEDMDEGPYPDTQIVPFIDTVQGRITLETGRGCIRACRFCQAAQLFRPVREKSPDTIVKQAKALADYTGYDEITLSSLSISDYSKIRELTDKMLEWTDPRKISINLPSLRADSFTRELMDKVYSVRSSTLTFAPEAGTQRLRDVINKNIEEKDIFQACRIAYQGGKRQVKLYFMEGLPTETDEDLEGMADLAQRIIDEFYKTEGRPKGTPQVTMSVACFVPKPFTAFQWEAQDSLETLKRKQLYVRDKITSKKIIYHYHSAEVSRIEAVFARGDRKLSKAILAAHNKGMKLDGWTEFFDYDKWCEVFSETGIDPDFYACRVRNEDEILPWDFIDIGSSKRYFLREKKLAYMNKTTQSCQEGCAGCEANSLGGKNTWCPAQSPRK